MTGLSFSPVAPIQVLEELWGCNKPLFGNYHLLLAHHVHEHQDRFSVLFHAASTWYESKGLPFTIIMDNSLVECGGAVDIEMVIGAADLMTRSSADVVAVLPDAMGDGATTRKLIEAEFSDWKQATALAGIELMMVLQGANDQDYMDSVSFADSMDIEWVGVPRVLVKTLNTRMGATQAARGLGRKIHLLGFSDNQVDDFKCSQAAGISGIDSAVPIRMDMPWYVDALAIPPRDPKWFDEGQLTAQNIANLQCARAVFENGMRNARGIA